MFFGFPLQLFPRFHGCFHTGGLWIQMVFVVVWKGCALNLLVRVCIETTNRGVHWNHPRGCALKPLTGVCIETTHRGVHWNYQQGCALQLLWGVCIYQTNAHPCRELECTPLSKSVELWSFTNAHPCRKLEYAPLSKSVELWSDPVGARLRRAKARRRRAPRRPQLERNKPAHLSLPYDRCPVTHP